jgi:DNA-binding NarL/FixJ family response regulator
MADSAAPERPRVLIADDNEATRHMFRLLAELECEVVGEVENGRDTIEAVERLDPNLLVMDISMPDMSGFQAARILTGRVPQLKIILASQHAHSAYADEALRLGVQGYVLKGAAATELPAAIREVLAGGIFRSPRIAI